ncbi:MAG: MinD/ParA family protein [Eubacterium sp.]|nr:MinD/ParA family protein [Eubacterium sp.]
MDQAQQLRNIIKGKEQKKKHVARVITITSGKGGVGKSNIAVNLAVQLQRMGKRAIVFDADFGLANVEVMFGTSPKYNLGDMIYKGRNIQDIITKGPRGIEFISAGSGISGLNNLNKDQITFFVNNLSNLDEMADFVLIDTGAGIADSVLDFVIASPEVLLVLTPDPSSLTDAYSLIKALFANPSFKKEQTQIQVVANKVCSQEDGKAVFHKLQAVVDKFLEGNLHFVGMIPRDSAMESAIRHQCPISIDNPGAASSEAFAMLAENLVSGKCNTYIRKKGVMQMFKDFFSRIRDRGI